MVTAQSQQLKLQPKLATKSDNLNLYHPASLRPLPLPPPLLTLPETLGAPVIPKSPAQMENFMVLVKLYYQGAVRGMPIASDLSWDAFLNAVLAKFGHPLAGLCMEFEDEEDNNERVRLQDQTDYELAISVARASMKDRPEARLKIWCTDKHP
ncbi:uncharacterized protein B0H18DRAFT_1121660 [Fomitopsis serialis]|uniref:uncharacterized protein n=1 Tax=Fomitopsis serialis TaxID=139415 RepID=UPI0020082FE7|nr:uncharacterized protein B0H18DRAFT_1121660 [Neoantrodia serialis]KAH9920935.1 hypothetical protein B0H18DRAFT_1121660 [Neoantrodia serialis]